MHAINLKDDLFVLKSFQLENNPDILFYALLEHFYCSIADALDTGPSMKKGIDLYLFGNEVGFLMEKCS